MLSHQALVKKIMELGRLLLCCLLAALIMLPSQTHATLPQEAYWTSKLPNIPMPESIRDNLKPLEIVLASNEVEPYMSRTYFGTKLKHEDPLAELSLFFLDKNMNVGNVITLRLIKKTNQAVFLLRDAIHSFPLSSARLDEILHRFSVKVGSAEAYQIEQTLKQCEKKFFENETRQCVTSLESMVDFATTWVGKDIRAISTTSKDSNDSHSKRKKYIIKTNIEKLEGNMLAACHKLDYPYALYQCHAFSPSQAYVLKVPLKGSDGDEVEALAVCHNYDFLPLWITPELSKIVIKMLKARPGVDPICHFLATDAVVWKPAS